MSTPAAEAYAKTAQPFPAPIVNRLGQRELTHSDHCDQCGAAAYVRTESYYTTFQLLWCAHHFTEHERNGHFSRETHAVLDERDFLTRAVKAQAGQE